LSLGILRLHCEGEAGRWRKRLGRAGKLGRLRGGSSIRERDGSRRNRCIRQHKCHRRHDRIFGILAAGHRAIQHSIAHVMPAIHIGVRRCLLFLVMMRGDRALVASATRHGMRRPGRRRQRCVQRHGRQQAYPCGKQSHAVWSRGIHIPTLYDELYAKAFLAPSFGRAGQCPELPSPP
jgi:hypothetical protein